MEPGELQNANPAVFSSIAPSRSYVIDEDEEDIEGSWGENVNKGSSSGVTELSGEALRLLAAASGGGGVDSGKRGKRDVIDALEVFELIRHLNDPEHPLTLEALNVAQLALIRVDDSASTVDIAFTPTIPHCS